MDRRAGRPRASSRETLAEAACELFLEQGFEATSIAEIATRAGVSRSSFFNYFSSKSDILWAAFDERLDAAESALSAGEAPIRAALDDVGAQFAPDSLALAIAQAAAMGISEELDRERALRQARLARAIAARLIRDGAPRLRAEIAAAAYAGAVLAALWEWSHGGPGRSELAVDLDAALDIVAALDRDARQSESAGVKQLRLVVRADDFDEALSFYRDTLGLRQAEAYEAPGGARVVILEAGRATLELANPAQVAFIDAVETEGGGSDRLRVAFEVSDTAGVVARLTNGGAEVEASARETPWRSFNARLRGPAGLQLTVFQELGPQ